MLEWNESHLIKLQSIMLINVVAAVYRISYTVCALYLYGVWEMEGFLPFMVRAYQFQKCSHLNNLIFACVMQWNMRKKSIFPKENKQKWKCETFQFQWVFRLLCAHLNEAMVMVMLIIGKKAHRHEWKWKTLNTSNIPHWGLFLLFFIPLYKRKCNKIYDGTLLVRVSAFHQLFPLKW